MSHCTIVDRLLTGCATGAPQVTKLIETAALKWRKEEGDYRDDITAIAIDLKLLHKAHFNKD